MPKETVRSLVNRLRSISKLAYPDIPEGPLRENLLIEPFIRALTDIEQRKCTREHTPITRKVAADVAELYEMTNGIEQKRVDSAVPPAFSNNGKKPVRALCTNDDCVMMLCYFHSCTGSVCMCGCECSV